MKGPNSQAAPHEAFSLEEGTYVEGDVLVLVDGQLPQSNSRSTQSETQDLFSFSEMVASTTEGDLLVGEEDPDNPSVDSDYFEAVASLSNDMTNLEGIPDGKKVGRTGYLTTPINVQSIG